MAGGLALMLAGCGDVTGRRAEPPPPPTIAPGTYVANPSGDPGVSWVMDLAKGGESRVALVRRCTTVCVPYEVPVRRALNGLAITVPGSEQNAPVDLAISVTPQGLRLSYVRSGAFLDAPLRDGGPFTG